MRLPAMHIDVSFSNIFLLWKFFDGFNFLTAITRITDKSSSQVSPMKRPETS